MTDYRFEYKIVDPIADTVIVSGSTYVRPESIDEYGGCESVDTEVGSGMRYFRNKGRALHEDKLEDKPFDEIWK